MSEKVPVWYLRQYGSYWHAAYSKEITSRWQWQHTAIASSSVSGEGVAGGSGVADGSGGQGRSGGFGVSRTGGRSSIISRGLRSGGCDCERTFRGFCRGGNEFGHCLLEANGFPSAVVVVDLIEANGPSSVIDVDDLLEANDFPSAMCR